MQEVTALAFDDIGGFQMAVGSSSGKVKLHLLSCGVLGIEIYMTFLNIE